MVAMTLSRLQKRTVDDWLVVDGRARARAAGEDEVWGGWLEVAGDVEGGGSASA